MTPVVLITVQPRVVSTGATTTVRLAGGGSRQGYYYGGNHYRAGVASMPRFQSQLGFDEDGWTGRVIPTAAAITWAPSSKAKLSELAAYLWPGAAITVEHGYEETGTFSTKLTGKVADVIIQDHRVAITVADLSDGLDRPLLTARFAGTGAAEGATEATGRIKRRTWGRAFNIEGRVLDKANNIYEFGDLSYQLQSFETVRDKGKDASPAPTVLAWQGSVAATLTALVASSPAQGSGVVAPSIACVKWWTQPAGPLTADVKGEVGSGYVETAPEIAASILTAASGPSVTNTAAMATARSGAAGIHVDEGETTASVIDRLLMGVSLLWLLNPVGTVTLRELTFTSPVEALQSDTVQRQRTFMPVKTRRLGYQRSYRVHSDGEIAVQDPTPGSSSALIYIYQRATSAPALPSATTTYTFATGGLTGLNNGWSSTIPAGTDPLYVATAQAIGTSATDTIASGEWATPQVLADRGISAATVFLYQRNNTGVPPAGPSSTLTYTFATGVLSGTLGSWTQTVPADSGGAYLFVTTATALGSSATDSILSSEWATVRTMAQNGAHGGLVKIYKRSATSPTLPSATATYTFATGALSGLNNGWTATPPAGTDPLYVSVATASSSGATDDIASGEWATPAIETGAGLNYATVFLFQRNTTGVAPTAPGSDTTYTFSSGVLSGTLGSWTQTVPADSNGEFLFVTTAAALAATATDTITSGEWSAVRLMAQDGAEGLGGTAWTPGTLTNLTRTGSKFAKTASTPDGTVTSVESIVGAKIAFSALTNEVGIHLKSGANTYGISFGSDGIYRALQNGSTVATGSTFASADIFSLSHEGTTIVLRKGEVTFHTFTGISATAAHNVFVTMFGAAAATAQFHSPVNGVDGAAGSTGPAGSSNGLVKIYQRAASAPSVPSATVTYTFATGGLSGLNNGWSATIPAENGNPLYVTVATASAAAATDTIASGEWATPVIETGAGLNAATVFLYQRNGTGTAPSVPSATTTYTFSTGVLTGINNGWSQSIPAHSGGKYLFVTHAAALGASATDTIASGEWSTVRTLTEDGDDGATGATGSAGLNAWDHSVLAGGVVQSSGNTFTYSGGGTINGVYDGRVISTQKAVGAFASCRPTTTGVTDLIIGLDNNPAGFTNYTTIDYMVYISSAGTLERFSNGVSQGAAGSWSLGDDIRVEHRGDTAVILKNGAVVTNGTWTGVSPTTPLGLCLGFDNNGAVTAVTFGVRGLDGGGASSGAYSLNAGHGAPHSIVIAVTAGTIYFDGLMTGSNTASGGSHTFRLYNEAGTLVHTISSFTSPALDVDDDAFSNSYATGIAAGVYKQWTLKAEATRVGASGTASTTVNGTWHQ